MPNVPVLGINFSHRHAEWLNQDPDALFARLLDELGVRYVRLSAYWDEIAPSAERMDFTPLRRFLDPLQQRGGRALVTVGLKAQRWPEYYPPEWLTRAHPLPDGARLDDHPRVIAHLLLMLERVTAFLADYDAIDAWQVENEPSLPSLRNTVGWLFSPDLLAREIAVVREADPRHRPIVVNHSSQNCLDRRWQVGLRLADVIAENVYTRKPNRWPWPRYFNVHAIPLYAPPLRRYGEVAGRLGKGYWITELQAEPWERQDVHTVTPEMICSVSPKRIRENLRLVRRAGAQRIYLWGAEWWRFTADRDGDERYWELARRLFGARSVPRV
jgi:hypothetical protein